MFDFEKLDVWQKAIDFADLVHNHMRDFPTDERFGLTNQNAPRCRLNILEYSGGNVAHVANRFRAIHRNRNRLGI